MSVGAHILRRLAAAGLDAAQVAEVVAIFDEEDEARRAAKREGNRERQHRRRHAESRVTERDMRPVTRDTLPPKEKSPEPPKEITPNPSEIDEKRQRALFAKEYAEIFYPAYPRHQGKEAGLKAFCKARLETDLDTMMDGVRRYSASRVGEDPQYTAQPGPWINGKRWQDEYDPTTRRLRVVHGRGPPLKPERAGDSIQRELMRGTVHEQQFEDYPFIDGEIVSPRRGSG